MYKSIIGLIIFSTACISFPSDEVFIEPTANFSINFCNFPHSWTASKGKDVTIGVVFSPKEDYFDWGKLVANLAPEASVRVFVKEVFLDSKIDIFDCQVIFLAEHLSENELGRAIKTIKNCREKGIIVVLPAYFGPMKTEQDYTPWRNFIKEASSSDAVIVGIHGRSYQLGNIEFWKSIPVDVFALSRRVDGDRYFGTSSMIESSNLEESSYLVAGAAALLRSLKPALTPKEIKEIFQNRGRKILWMISDVKWTGGEDWQRAWPVLNRDVLKRQEEKLKKNGHRIVEVLERNCFDAALTMGLDPMGYAEWCLKALNIDQAQKMATGKGVIVAILDHMFKAEDPSLKGRIFKAGSVLEGAPVFEPEESLGHGTWMARDLVLVAPDVKIMPVRFCGQGRYGDPELYIKGIEYAVREGAHIISISHQAIPEERQADFDEAINKAAEKGVVVVYIWYQGSRDDVVATKPIEFAPFFTRQDNVYIIGTNFINKSSFPFTWGVSQTAPIVSGVIALMKELAPDLKPAEIRRILQISGKPISSGYQILDALKALHSLKDED